MNLEAMAGWTFQQITTMGQLESLLPTAIRKFINGLGVWVERLLLSDPLGKAA